jgi:hypothetical protein
MADYFSFKSAPGIEVPAPSSREEIIEQLLRLVNEQLSSQVTEALKDSVEVDDDALKPSAGAPSEENKRAGSAALARLRGLSKKPTPPDTLKASNETETDDGLGDLLDNQLVQIRNMLSNAVAVRGRNGSQADGSIPTETLSLNFERMPLRTQNGSASGKPFLMPVEDVFTISGRGTSSTNGHTPFFKGYRPQFYMRTSDVSRPAAAGDHWTFPARTAAPTSGALNPQKFQIISAGAGRRATITGLPVVGDWDGDPLSNTHGSGIPAHTPEWANPRSASGPVTPANGEFKYVPVRRYDTPRSAARTSLSNWRLASAQPMKGKPFSTDYTMFLPNGTPVRSTVAGTGNEAAMESLTIAHEGFTPALHRGGNMSLPEVGDAVLVGFAHGDRRDVEPTGVEFPNLSFQRQVPRHRRHAPK